MPAITPEDKADAPARRAFFYSSTTRFLAVLILVVMVAFISYSVVFLRAAAAGPK